jgi:putative phosphoesterase
MAGSERPSAVLEAARTAWGPVDAVWHTGDLAGPEVLAQLQDVVGVPVIAVRGNADVGSWADVLPALYATEVEGTRIAMVHGWGSPRYIVDRICRKIGWQWDVIIFGHTHSQFCQRLEGVLFLNPGSAADRRISGHRGIAKLTVDGKVVLGQLIDLEPYLTAPPRPLE